MENIESSSSKDDEVAPLPQTRRPGRKTKSKTAINVPIKGATSQLARSLVGELVLTPSYRNLLLELDDSERSEGGDGVDDSERYNERMESVRKYQRQFTIAKKKTRVSPGMVHVLST